MSGEQGKGSAGEPFDQGNAEGEVLTFFCCFFLDFFFFFILEGPEGGGGGREGKIRLVL